MSVKTFIDLTERVGFKPDVKSMLEDLNSLHGNEWIDHYDPTLSSDYVALTLYSIDGRTDGPETQRHLPLSEYGRYQPTNLLAKLPYFSTLLEEFKCRKGRIRISKLGPGARIAEHRDVWDEAASYAFGQVRLHIPIKTNPSVKFVIDGARCPMSAGRLYYGDFTKRHYVENPGSEVRTHLVMDFMLNDWLRTLFAPIGPLDRISMASTRTFTPIYWQLLKSKNRLRSSLWKAYDGSAIQSAFRSLK